MPLVLVAAATQVTEPKRARGDLTPLEPPNVCLTLHARIELHGAFGIRRQTDRLRLRVDDPAALIKALRG